MSSVPHSDDLPQHDPRGHLVDALRRQLGRWERAAGGEDAPVFSCGAAVIDRLLPGGGLRHGTLVEWIEGSSALEVISKPSPLGRGQGEGESANNNAPSLQPSPGGRGSAATLSLLSAREACREGGALVLIDRQQTFYPPAAAAWGIDLERLIVVRPRNARDELWAAVQSLRSPAVAAMWAAIDRLDSRTFRRLQLAAQAGRTLGLLVRPARARAQPSWADVRLEVESRAAVLALDSRPSALDSTRHIQIHILHCHGGRAGGSMALEIDDVNYTVRETSSTHDAHSLPMAAQLADSAAHSLSARASARPLALVMNSQRGKLAPGSAGGLTSGSMNPQSKNPGKTGGYQQDSRSAPNIVVACCRRARSQGIQPGMPLAEAQALVRGLASATYEPQADRRALEKLAEACERFSPRVALEEGDEPESLLLDISNLEHLWGSETVLVNQVKKFFTRRGYRARLAVAETVGAAWAAAHCEGNPNDETRMTNERTENSSFVIRHSSLPIESLRIADDTATLLRDLGIETIAQLQSLPREGLAARFGNELLRRLDQWTGAGQEIIEPHRGLAALEARDALEEPTSDRFVLLHVLSQLVRQLAQQLAARDQGAVLLICLLRCTNKQVIPLRVGLLQPSTTARQLLELIELHLETIKLADEVDRVEIRAAVVGRLGERQGVLFADRWSNDPHQLALLVNRLSSRLGEEQVLRAKLARAPCRSEQSHGGR